MSYLEALFLGALQGLTEFLPVSSSGHLVLAQALLGVKQPGVAFEVALHFGSWMAVVAFFHRTILRLIRSLFDSTLKQERAMIGLLLLASVPAGLVGLLLKDSIESAFSSPLLTSVFLIGTGLLLFSSRFMTKGSSPVRVKSSIIMGIGQALAVLPGISRSGSTIVFGMASGVDPAKAAEFSFLLSLPAIGGAMILNAKELAALNAAAVGPYLAGTAVSFVLSLIAVYSVLAIIRRGRFSWFAYYCFAAAALGLYLCW
jgi:undecaprenyl-diphosphatase